MSHSPSQTLLSLHQLFTSGYTKGNPGALIVAKRNSSPSLLPQELSVPFLLFLPLLLPVLNVPKNK